jgi:hypothetical protein
MKLDFLGGRASSWSMMESHCNLVRQGRLFRVRGHEIEKWCEHPDVEELSLSAITLPESRVYSEAIRPIYELNPSKALLRTRRPTSKSQLREDGSGG